MTQTATVLLLLHPLNLPTAKTLYIILAAVHHLQKPILTILSGKNTFALFEAVLLSLSLNGEGE